MSELARNVLICTNDTREDTTPNTVFHHGSATVGSEFRSRDFTPMLFYFSLSSPKHFYIFARPGGVQGETIP